MPCMEITLPKIDTELKQRLSEALTRDFSESMGFPPDIFGIRFNEYDDNQASVGGTLIAKDFQERPYIHILFYCPRVSKSVKRKLGEQVNHSFFRIFEDSNWSPVIHICEHPYDNVVVEGKLLSDTYEECQGEFYYKM
jgi:phenylpyruvate tautomerase PptA (4-oxalocrotonate tautomerase family)